MNHEQLPFITPKPDPELFKEIDKVLDRVRFLWLNARTTENKRKWAKALDALLDERNRISKEKKKEFSEKQLEELLSIVNSSNANNPGANI